jgi:hypothetical protein
VLVLAGVRGIGMIGIGGLRSSCWNWRHWEWKRSYVYLWLVNCWLGSIDGSGIWYSNVILFYAVIDT